VKIPDTASSYSLGWVEDNDPRWDADRGRVFATVSEDMFPSSLRVGGRRLPGTWWRLTDGDSTVAHGWLHMVSDRAVALLAVADTGLGSGAGGFGVVRLGEEASSRGFNRVVEMRRRKYPQRAAVTVWILERARAGTDGSGGRAAETGRGWSSRG
jgi:hypothetical protein